MKIWGLRMGHFATFLILTAPRVRRDSRVRGLGQATNPAGAARHFPKRGTHRRHAPQIAGATVWNPAALSRISGAIEVRNQ
jgi:hypothetical protein